MTVRFNATIAPSPRAGVPAPAVGFGNAGVGVAALSPITRGLLGLVDASSAGFEMTKFMQDTASSLGGRLFSSRSKSESAEISFIEVMESLLVYFGVSRFAKHVFHPLYSRLAGATEPGKPAAFKAIGEYAPKALKHMAPVRAATILATLGTTVIGGEFVLLFLKNLMTLKVFQQDNFSDVVNLSQGKAIDPEASAVGKKARQRIKLYGGVALGAIVAGGVLAALGPRAKGLQRLSHGISKALDFHFVKNEKTGTVKAGLSLSLMKAFMGLAFLGYQDAARSRLEHIEVGVRQAVLFPYLLFGQEFLVKQIKRLFSPALFNAEGKMLDNKALERLAKDLAKASGKTAQQHVRQLARQKNAVFLLSHGIGTIGVTVALSELSKYFTKLRFQHEQQAKQQAQQHAQHYRAMPAVQPPLQTPFKAVASHHAALSSPVVFPAFADGGAFRPAAVTTVQAALPPVRVAPFQPA